MSDRVLAAKAQGVLTLTLNRPDKRNALDRALIDALYARLEEADLDASVSVVVLRGAGRDFCSGADLRELLESADRSVGQNVESAQVLGDVFVRMRELPKPIIAAVHGRALAGGCGLANACDLIVSHADAQFGYPEIQRGFVPAMVMAMLRRTVGERVAFDLMSTGRVLTAAEARDVGLVARVFAADAFEDDSRGIARRMARTSASALALLKKQLYAVDPGDFVADIALGAEVNATARATPDFRAAVAQFLEKPGGSGGGAERMDNAKPVN